MTGARGLRYARAAVLAAAIGAPLTPLTAPAWAFGLLLLPLLTLLPGHASRIGWLSSLAGVIGSVTLGSHNVEDPELAMVGLSLAALASLMGEACPPRFGTAALLVLGMAASWALVISLPRAFDNRQVVAAESLAASGTVLRVMAAAIILVVPILATLAIHQVKSRRQLNA